MFELFLELVRACGDDVMFDFEDTELEDLDLTFDDWAGFDDDYAEVDREYDHPDAVDALEDWIEEHATSIEGDYYRTYHFDGFSVTVGYTSMDI